MQKERSPLGSAHELNWKSLRYTCDASHFDFETTDQLDPLDGIIGQDRAVRAIDFGLEMRSFGYNIYAAGVPGTGKKSLIKSFVERIARNQPVPPDILYVHNFQEPDYPRSIKLTAGLGSEFKQEMERLVSSLKEELPRAFQSEDYERRKSRIIDAFQGRRNTIIEQVQAKARESGLAIKGAESQVLTIPLANGEELTADEFERLPQEQQEEIRRKQKILGETIKDAYREIRDFQDKAQNRLRELDHKVAWAAAGHFLERLRTRYQEQPAVLEYLAQVQESILEHWTDFFPETQENITPQALLGSLRAPEQRRGLKPYAVNLVVDNSRQQGAPVIVESHPTYRNLIGVLERQARMGTLYTDFTMIRPGSVLKANGGYLILDITDLLTTPFAWDSLKRVLQDKQVNIEDLGEQYGLVATAGLRPEAAEVDLKVIVSGNLEVYNLLYHLDEDFQKIFKIKADFDTAIQLDEDQLMLYARYIRKTCDEEGLRHFDREAVAALIEQTARMVSDQNRLTLRFSDVADLIRESSFWAGRNGDGYVRRTDVQKAIEEKRYRSNLVEERLQEMIDEATILIDTRGEKTGQINGLSVYQTGYYSFGKPTRITARVSAGDKGVVNIEREAKLSGNIHDKGVLILSGYLHGKYGQRAPLSLNASICFEQSYSGVEGDSASSAELYAIISSLSGVPLRQSLAVTGSVNQMGTIQPIGGVNEKIEGFYQTCKAEGLSGDQGVIIPKANVRNLMLCTEVIESVREGKFHIYAIENVDQGLEILTNREAGELLPEGGYQPGTTHGLVQQRLTQLSESTRLKLAPADRQKTRKLVLESQTKNQ
jgi:lon-related putative ATP-dependent protease